MKVTGITFHTVFEVTRGLMRHFSITVSHVG